MSCFGTREPVPTTPPQHWPSLDMGSMRTEQDREESGSQAEGNFWRQTYLRAVNRYTPIDWGNEGLNPVPRLRSRQHTTASHRTQQVNSLTTAGFPVSSPFSVGMHFQCWSPVQIKCHPYGVTSPLLLVGHDRFLHFWTHFYISFLVQGFPTWKVVQNQAHITPSWGWFIECDFVFSLNAL